jgi:4-hydroxybenzoate polyprenyltransferase
VSLGGCALAVARALLYFWFYSYIFCLPSQIVGVAEDRINKPDRPLPSGLVSVRGAYHRWLVSMVVYCILGWCFGVLKWALLWQAVTVFYAFGGLDRHWATKNLVAMTLGTVAQLAATWELVMPLTPLMWQRVLAIAVLAGVTALVQDFRDVQGDHATGRKTLPITLGERPARFVVIGLFLLAPLWVHWGLMPAAPTAATIACEVVLAAMPLAVAARLWLFRDPAADHKTYILYSYWYCAILASMIVIAPT